MTVLPRAQNTRKLRSIANITAVVVVAIVALIQLVPEFKYAFDPASYGEFGLSVELPSVQVAAVTPRSAADKAKIKVGDSVVLPLTLRDRAIFGGPFSPNPGELTTITVERGSARRTVTLKANPVRLSLVDATSSALIAVACLVYLAVGALLAVLSPSWMTWGFYAMGVGLIWIPQGNPSYIPTNWMLAYTLAWQALLVPFAVIGFLIFCLRFPSNRTVGWRQTAENAALILFVVLIVGQSFAALGSYGFGVSPAFAGLWQHVWNVGLAVAGVVGLTSVIATYRGSHGVERRRSAWIVLGFACNSIAFVFAALYFEGILPTSVANVGISTAVLLPLAVAYAVIRHRVIDVRFVVSRALVYGTIALVIIAVVAVLDWLFSTRFANSRWQTAVYAGIALLVGFVLNFARQRIGNMVDAIFFRGWHGTKEKVDALRDLVRRAGAKTAAYEPLTKGVAETFSLASVALFERTVDGGFVRVAAHGWSSCTLWHILSDDALATRVRTRPRISEISALEWPAPSVSSGVACPEIMVPIIAGKNVTGIVLLSAHEDGTRLDPDELRAIRGVCSEAALLFSIAPLPQLEPASRIDPLPAQATLSMRP